MRGTLDDLASPHPLGLLLPGLYHDNDLAQRFTAALDVVLAPVLATLDSGEAYVDPRLAPLDFVEWLASWVGVELDASWPEHRQRALVARAGDLYAWRGTVRGVREAVAIYTGVEPEISETGGTAWTGTPPPTGELPGAAAGQLLVRVRVPPGEPVDAGRLDRLVAAAKPAHIAHRVEIVEDRRLRPAPDAVPPPPPEPPDLPDDLDSDWPAPPDAAPEGTVARGKGIAPTPAPEPPTAPSPPAEPPPPPRRPGGESGGHRRSGPPPPPPRRRQGSPPPPPRRRPDDGGDPPGGSG